MSEKQQVGSPVAPGSMAATQPGMAPTDAGMPTLDPAGLEPAPMLSLGSAPPPPAVSAAPAVPLGEVFVPPPPGATMSDDDRN